MNESKQSLREEEVTWRRRRRSIGLVREL